MIVRNCGKDHNAQLLIFDRKEDPITPLLSQWTYQVNLIEINKPINKLKQSIYNFITLHRQ